MECLGFSLLDGKTLFQVVVVMISSIVASIHDAFMVTIALAQHKSSLFFMVTLDFFSDATNGCGAGSVSFSVTASSTWSTYESVFHGESVVGAEFFTGVEFGCKCL